QPGSRRRRGPERLAVGAFGILRLPGFASRVHADGVPGLEPDVALAEDVVELPAVHRPVLRHERGAAMAGDVEHDAAGDDALLPVLDGAEAGPVEGDLLLG